MRKQLVFNTFLLALSLSAIERDVPAATLIVGTGPGRFSSPSGALAAAQAGDTIEVEAGTYAGDLVVNKKVLLQGVGRPVLRGSGRGSVLLVEADGSSVRGFVIEHSGGDLQKEDSGILLKSGKNRIEDNEIRDALYGIYFYHSENNVVRRNVIRGRRELSLGERGAGLHLWNSPDNRIEDNTISEMRDGLYIQSSSGNFIRNNRVFNLRYGIHYMFSNENEFEDNVFARNVAGAAIMYSKDIKFRRNSFLNNRGFSSFGILFQACDQLLAEENHIIDNTTGIFLEALRNSRFQRNVIAHNDVALQMFASSGDNTFSRNSFVENLSPLLMIGKGSNTRWQSEGQGNFWNDYSGYDLDADGVGDLPHRIQNIFQHLEGNYPRLRIYFSSPAAQALAAAEKILPVIQGSPEIDSRPLLRAGASRLDIASAGSGRGFSTAMSLIMILIAASIIWRSQR
jgi:nitrous oxidase accessory protein